jgi:hypothetical protein
MMHYIGDGTMYWPGIPMRDLSAEEWAALPAATQAALLANQLFAPAPVLDAVEPPLPKRKEGVP